MRYRTKLRGCGLWVVYNASCSNLILVKNPCKVINKYLLHQVFFLSANVTSVIVDDNIRYQVPKLRWLMTEIRAASLMMVMDCLCLSIHSFKFILAGFIPLRTDQRYNFYDVTGDSGKWQVSLDNVNNPVSDNASSIRCLFPWAEE